MIYLLEALPALLLGAAAAYGGWRVVHRLGLRRARWRSRIRPGGSGPLIVEVAREGDPPQLVARLDPAAADFDERLFEAQARADNLAAALNASRR